MAKNKDREPDANRDPISGAPGSHPVGVGAGAAAGAATGAAVGSLGGPVGTAVGTAVGGIAGGLAGKGVAESINPTVEDAYWREHYAATSYVAPGEPYADYQPAYRYGWEARSRYKGLTWDEAEEDLERNWDTARGTSKMTWARAKHAVRDAWHRVERAIPGDADRDGR